MNFIYTVLCVYSNVIKPTPTLHFKGKGLCRWLSNYLLIIQKHNSQGSCFISFHLINAERMAGANPCAAETKKN